MLNAENTRTIILKYSKSKKMMKRNNRGKENTILPTLNNLLYIRSLNLHSKQPYLEHMNKQLPGSGT